MNDILFKTGNAVLLNIFQILLGYVLSIPLYRFLIKGNGKRERGYLGETFVISGSAAAGIILPLGPFGSLPLIAAAANSGIRLYRIVPLFITGVLFNSAVPFTEIHFLWGRSMNRILWAFIIGIGSGVILMLLKWDENKIFNRSNLNEIGIQSNHFLQNIQKAGIGMSTLGIYLIPGAIINTLFHKYVFYDFITTVYSNKNAFEVMKIFLNHNASMKPLFILAITIVNMLMNLQIAAGVLLLFKFKGIATYFLYYSIWVFILVATVFI